VVLLALVALVAGGAYAATQLLGGAEQRVVPDVKGQDVTVATQRLRAAGFEVKAVRRRSVRPRDRVFAQRPGSGARADKGSTVEIRVSDGPGIDQVPQVKGLRRSQAIDALEKAGFEVRERRRSSDAIGENRAISTDPPAGSQLEGGQTVTLTISTGPPIVDVPDVVGSGRREATSTLEDARFEVEVVERDDEDADPGTVIAQDPAGGAAVPRGSTVTIIVARRPPRVTVPSVGGSSLADAGSTLRGLGLRVSSSEQPVTDPSQDGTVISQDPAPGTAVKRGSTVTLVVGRAQDTGEQPSTDEEPPPPEDGATIDPNAQDGQGGPGPGEGPG
jgi:eukaryotic-like serine/threonine-protein kinase